MWARPTLALTLTVSLTLTLTLTLTRTRTRTLILTLTLTPQTPFDTPSSRPPALTGIKRVISTSTLMDIASYSTLAAERDADLTLTPTLTPTPTPTPNPNQAEKYLIDSGRPYTICHPGGPPPAPGG